MCTWPAVPETQWRTSGPHGRASQVAPTRSRRLEDVCELQQAPTLGRGTFGVVYKGFLRKDGCVDHHRPVAIKVIRKDRLRSLRVNPSTVVREVDMMRLGSAHTNCVRLYDFIETSTVFALIQECCEGGSLQERIDGVGVLGEQQVRVLMQQMIKAVCFLHSHDVCHRDVKPHNYMLQGRVNHASVVVKLGDFGTAMVLCPGVLTKEKVGTPAFMSPEMHLLPEKSSGYDNKVDMWALGVCMVFLLANEYPFVDGAGQLIHHRIIRGEVPLWDVSGFAGLFKRAGQAAGVYRKRPSKAAQALTRQLLNPRRQPRLNATEALGHDWFSKPLAQYEEMDDTPLLDMGEFEVGLKAVEKEIVQGFDMAASTVGFIQVLMENHTGRRRFCFVCQRDAGELGYVCPRCKEAVCMSCLGHMAKPCCPHCHHESADVYLHQAATHALSWFAEQTQSDVGHVEPRNAQETRWPPYDRHSRSGSYTQHPMEAGTQSRPANWNSSLNHARSIRRVCS